MRYFGAIEGGGTKFICAVGNEYGEIIDKIRISTITPDVTIPEAIKYLQKANDKWPLSAIGIGCFGPLDLQSDSPSFGTITNTPKLSWRSYPIYQKFVDAFHLPIAMDTDVNAAALGEQRWGAAQTLSTFVYITVGTGIGAGVIVNNELHHGLIHPEMGHMYIPQDKIHDEFQGVCYFHNNCLEGLASGPALKERWEVDSALDLPPDHPAWQLEADYLSSAIINIVGIISPQRFLLGGGVMAQQQLFPLIRAQFQEKLQGYLHHPSFDEDIDEYIVPPGLGDAAGIKGALALAIKTYEEHNNDE